MVHFRKDSADAGEGAGSAKVAAAYNRVVHLVDTGWAEQPAVNPSLDWESIESQYFDAAPRAAIIDGLLTPEALSELRRFCLDSTIWFEIKGAGYLGSYFRDGFSDPLLLRIAEEFRRYMPRVIGPHPLQMIWAYSYEQSMVGINPHADFARLNVNFWITPDQSNLDPESGGLKIYEEPAPADWSFEDYNSAPGTRILEFLGESADRPLRIPHRSNRAVLFDSRLFHETDRMRFAPGFENRRINITMLFGDGG